MKALPSSFSLPVSLEVRYDESFFHPSRRPRFALAFLPQGGAVKCLRMGKIQIVPSNERPVTPSDTSTPIYKISSVVPFRPKVGKHEHGGNPRNVSGVRVPPPVTVHDECLLGRVVVVTSVQNSSGLEVPMFETLVAK